MRPESQPTEVRGGDPFRCFDRRYLITLIPAFAGLVIMVVLVLALPRGQVRLILVQGLAAAAMGYGIVISVTAIRRLDELQQRIHLQAIAISFTAAAVLATSERFLEVLGIPTVSGFGLWIFMWVVWLAGVFVLRRRYR